MTNSVNRKENLITPEKAASFIPLFISAGVSILIFILFVIPQYFKSTQVNLELNGLIKKKNDLDNLKKEYKLINEKFDKLSKEKLKIIELISGKSNLETLLAKFGEIGRKNKIKFKSIVPKKVMLAIASDQEENKNKNDNANDNDNVIDVIIDPLLVEGTKKYEIDFSFNTEFINLLNFLRELEFQENIILINDIDLRISSDNKEIKTPFEVLEANLSVSFYGQI